MKTFFLALGLALTMTSAAQAYDYGYGRRVTCTATDNGWEEHWGGHSSCSQCTAVHGRCTETCSSEEYRCTAEGTVSGYGSSSTRTETFRGRGDDRWDAERDALNECRRYNAQGCTIKECGSDTQIVSSRGC